MQIANERRGQPRAALESTVIAFIGDERIECRAIDISATGIALLAPVVRPTGQFLRVNFALPTGGAPKWLDADGVVARVSRVEHGVLLGVQFLVIEDRAAREVHAYVEFTRDQNARARQQEVFVRRASGSTSAGTTSIPAVSDIAVSEEERMPDANHPPRATGEFVPAGQRRTDSYGRVDAGEDTHRGLPPRAPTPPETAPPRAPTPTGVVPPRVPSPSGSLPRLGMPLVPRFPTAMTPRAQTPTGIAPPGQGPGAIDPRTRGASESSGARWPTDTVDERAASSSGSGRWPGEHTGGGASSSQSTGGGRFPGEAPGAAGSSSHSTGGRPRVGTDPNRPRVEDPRRGTEPRQPAASPAPTGTRRPTTATQRASDPPPAAPAVSNKDLAALYRDALNEVDGDPKKKKKR